MRLTLRTLLAYLDDTLEPQQAREIGQKVAESAPARELIERIRQVVRRRRLGAPPVTGDDPDFDANIVAEYLDSALSDEELTELEGKCLADDQRLAEVASCHQILALVLGESARVPPKARERMYELGRDPAKAARRRGLAASRRAQSNALPAHEEADEKLLLGLPRGSNSGIGFWMPFLAGCLLVGALVALWMSMGSTHRELAQLAGNSGNEKQSINTTEKKPAETGQQLVEQPKEKLPPVGNGNEQPANPPTPAPPTPAVTANEKPENPSKPAATVIEWPSPSAKPDNRRLEIGTPILIAGVPNLLLEKASNQPAWKRLPPEKSRVWATDQLLALPGYRAEVRLDSGVNFLLWGNLPDPAKPAPPVLESAVTINSLPGIDLDLTLERGRVLIFNHKKEGPALVRIRFGNEIWDVLLYSADAEVGLESVATCPPWSKDNEAPDRDVALLVFKGEASLKARHEEFLMHPATLVTWDNSSGMTTRPRALPRLPDWYIGKNTLAGSTSRDVNQALENLGRITTTKTVDVALGECLHANDSATRVLAIRCLGATGDLSSVFNAIGDEKRPDLRAAAVDELRHLLAVNSDSVGEIERVAKQRGCSDKQIVTIRQLLQGFDEKQWSEPIVRSTVVDYLLHDKLIIRQLANSLLVRRYPEGQRIGYDAGSDPRKRERTSEEWKALVQPPQKKKTEPTLAGKT